MPSWLEAGPAIEAILVIIAIEALAVAWRGPRGRIAGWLANLAAGAFLLLAVRGALAGAPAAWLAALLAASGLAHGIDVLFRIRT